MVHPFAFIMGVQISLAWAFMIKMGQQEDQGDLVPVISTIITGNVTTLILIVSPVSCSSPRVLTQCRAGVNDMAEVITAHMATM